MISISKTLSHGFPKYVQVPAGQVSLESVTQALQLKTRATGCPIPKCGCGRGRTQGQDSPLPYFSAINPMSQNPLKLDQQVPRHIWGSHGRWFWMQSSPNLQSSGPKLALLSWKVKIETKSLTKLKNRPHASHCRKNCQHMPTQILRAMIQDGSSYLRMLKTSVALDADLIPGPFCAFLGLQIVWRFGGIYRTNGKPVNYRQILFYQEITGKTL